MDQVFMDKLVKPHSWYWRDERPKDDEDQTIKQKIIRLGEGSSFSDKVTMLGIVEATFGGQKGYLKKIVDQELQMSK